jgi:hypothetical protein
VRLYGAEETYERQLSAVVVGKGVEKEEEVLESLKSGILQRSTAGEGEREEDRGPAFVEVKRELAPVRDVDLHEIEFTLSKSCRFNKNVASSEPVGGPLSVHSTKGRERGSWEEGILGVPRWSDFIQSERDEVLEDNRRAARHASTREDEMFDI